MNDREALGEALHEAPSFRTGLQNNLIDEAAYERLAQLPENCGTCDGAGRIFTASSATLVGVCPACHGSGKVYPAELVLRIEAVLDGHVLIGRYEALSDLAVAVLDALNGETPDERSSRLARQFKDQPGSLDALNGETE